jgi:hypothetical protein
LSDITTKNVGSRSDALSEYNSGFCARGSKQKSDGWKIHFELDYRKVSGGLNE